MLLLIRRLREFKLVEPFEWEKPLIENLLNYISGAGLAENQQEYWWICQYIGEATIQMLYI